MPQISFTPKNQTVYDRFSRLLLEEQLKRGKLTAPQFLDIVLDKWEDVKPVSLRTYIADAEANDPWKNLGDSMEVAAKALNEFGSVSKKLSDE